MKLTRREILKSFLGLPFILKACRFEQDIAGLTGEILGADAKVGHLIRDYSAPEVIDENIENKAVVIVGGGIAGLTAAWKFKKSNFHDFVLLELEPRIGGTAQSGRNSFISYPWGAHYLPVPLKENQPLIDLLNEMGLIEGRDERGEVLIKEEYLCRYPEERIFYRGRWYEGLYPHIGESERDKQELAEFQKKIDFWVNWRDSSGRRAFTLPVANCSDDAETSSLDKISFSEWLRMQGFSSERLLWYCNYACRDDYGLTIDETSAWAGLFYFCSRVRESGDEAQPFITFPEGNGYFVDYFYSKVKEHVRLKAAVVEIITNDNDVTVVYLDVVEQKYRAIKAKMAIFAAPMFTARFVIRDFKENPPDYLKEFEHNCWFVANLTLKDRPKSRFQQDFPLSWDNVIYDSPSLGYVCATHQKCIDYGPTVFTYYHPMGNSKESRMKLFSLGWEELVDIILMDLSRAHKDINSLVERIDIMRWGHAMISPRPAFVRSQSLRKAQKPYRNIFFANTDLSGVALFEEAFFHGNRAADEILRIIRHQNL